MPRGSVLHSEERAMVLKVFEKCLEEKECGNLSVSLEKPAERTANYCGVSSTTVYKIRKEIKENPDKVFSTPGKKR